MEEKKELRTKILVSLPQNLIDKIDTLIIKLRPEFKSRSSFIENVIKDKLK